jgi:hypothetical protein
MTANVFGMLCSSLAKQDFHVQVEETLRIISSVVLIPTSTLSQLLWPHGVHMYVTVYFLVIINSQVIIIRSVALKCNFC